ncbi:MAG: outer membrane beta-barrel protein [Alphaproteobacteria bacterium]|nr:outer membrane beta-barrel protein [Alphaproteobacteria bacterium]
MLKNLLLASALGLSAYAVGMADARTDYGQAKGWYLGVEGGVNWMQDADGALDTPGPGSLPFEAQFDTGWAVLAEVGYRWESNWRLEFELGYRANDVDCVSFNGGPCGPFNADVSQFTQMFNLVYDIPLDDRLTLSLGAGLGADAVTVDAPFFKDTTWVAAGQLIAGLNFALTDDIDLFINYRYFIADDPHINVAPFVQAGFDDAKHTVTIGLRFDLSPDDEPEYREPRGPEPTMGPPPPPSGPAKHYVVFFGFNKTNLTVRAQEVVAEAAATAKEGGAAQILVTGHTDTVGSRRYNQGLSERRARVVKHELVRLGVPANSIRAIGKGETMLLVQTPDRTWEDRNRRATIDLN